MVDYTISYYSDVVQAEILGLPGTLAARYIVLTRRMVVLGPNLGAPHTKAFGDGLFELRLKGAEGIARVFFCTLVAKRIRQAQNLGLHDITVIGDRVIHHRRVTNMLIARKMEITYLKHNSSMMNSRDR